MVPNETLMRRVHEHMDHVPLEWTAEEQAFAKSCQKAMELPELGMATEVMPFVKDFTVGGSSDVADVSWNTPASFFGWPTHPIGVSAHNWAVTACGGTTIGDKGSIGAAALLAALGMDLLTDEPFRTAVRAEFEKRVVGRKYEATLDPDPAMIRQSAKRFIKGAGEEGISGIDSVTR
jgi:aminobenzoyl-glutamate utilization protein B